MHLKGNDLRYNVYLRKIQKLTRKELGLDVEAFKNYVHNLKEFAKFNVDQEILDRDDLETPVETLLDDALPSPIPGSLAANHREVFTLDDEKLNYDRI